MRDDLEVDSPPDLPPPRPEPSRAPFLIAVLVVVLGLAVAGWWTYRVRHHPEPSIETPPSTPSEPSVQPPGIEASRSTVQLPELDASDPFVRERLAEVSDQPDWPRWLSVEGLVRRFVAAVSTVGEGKSPHDALEHLPVGGAFAVRTEGTRTVIDGASFARYDRVVNVLASLDTAKARELWRLLHPLCTRAWAEIAPPDRGFDSAVLAAIGHLLATPATPSEIDVVASGGLYRYADPALEALSPAQKHLVRMGPQNAAKVRQALERWRSLVAD